ncbi:dienelactone hydrolase family protein [Sodiomyces alkalinus F11]|uniref:Dienelactone hydrolase family protein n=1 Tax=Sodiomyces alkalinus (strain CBS 110278 / VKM F-3762 / F11) TaxID=1314773 RepID=A0A3N2PJX0_SODAK|nr:dienelactone hydrolase family protein [Sodiomyces alkalinus F11]ROT34730.1 dienelactone hydrolase family protein [Sodiomyces alkalinus F11]
MSTMPAQHGHSEACCNIPPVVSKGYEEKGSYDEVGSYKTYVTGPADATKGILCVYDVFGYFPQTIQGMDILATSGAQKYRVLVPDWFKGEPCPIEWFPPNTPEKQRNLGNFFQKFPPQIVADSIPFYIKAAQDKYPEIKDWGIIGFCWGGKVTTLATSNENSAFKAAAACHPAMVDPADAQGVKAPLIMLPSKDEDVEAVKKFEEGLKVPHRIETFPDQIHGWMAARSNLEDPRVREEYTRGYKTVLDFFSKHL